MVQCTRRSSAVSQRINVNRLIYFRLDCDIATRSDLDGGRISYSAMLGDVAESCEMLSITTTSSSRHQAKPFAMLPNIRTPVLPVQIALSIAIRITPNCFKSTNDSEMKNLSTALPYDSPQFIVVQNALRNCRCQSPKLS